MLPALVLVLVCIAVLYLLGYWSAYYVGQSLPVYWSICRYTKNLNSVTSLVDQYLYLYTPSPSA